MGVFAELLDQLERDIVTVHGARRSLEWGYNPHAEPEARWYCAVLARCAGAAGYQDHVTGPNGETPLRRLAEDYAARAHLVRERKGKK